MRDIRKVAVLGAGTMGARIAAHLANASIPSVLLDIVPRELTPDEQAKGLTLKDAKVRNRFAQAGLGGLGPFLPGKIGLKGRVQGFVRAAFVRTKNLVPPHVLQLI